jgi:hypothetical protein
MKTISVFIFLFLSAQVIYSCDCPPVGSLSPEKLKHYDVIFKGRVDSVVFNNSKAIAWFSVDTLFKGSTHKTAGVYFDHASICKMNFDKADEWLIYGEYVSFGKLEVSVCSRSRKYFADETADFYIATNGIRYADELTFLRTNQGVQPFIEKESTDGISMQRELIHPSQTQMICWLLASLAGFLVIYFLFKKFVK